MSAFGALTFQAIVCSPFDKGGSVTQYPSVTASYEPPRSGDSPLKIPASARTILLVGTAFPSTVRTMLKSGLAERSIYVPMSLVEQMRLGIAGVGRVAEDGYIKGGEEKLRTNRHGAGALHCIPIE